MHVVGHGTPGQLVPLVDDLVPQVRHEGREAGVFVQFAVRVLRRVQSHRRGDREDRDLRATQRREVTPVEVEDLPPVRVEVRLGEHAGDVRTQALCLAQEVDLGRRQLLARVRDEQDQVRGRQDRHRRAVVPRPDATDARRVDEDQAAGEQRAGQLDLRVREPPLVPGIGRLAHDLRDLEDLDRLADQLDLLTGGIRVIARAGSLRPPAMDRLQRDLGGRVDQRRLRALTVPDHRRHRGRDVVVDGADGGVHHRVDQQALALLELADDERPDALVGQPPGRLGEPFDQVGTVGRGCRGAGPFHELPQWLQRICPHAFAIRRTRPRTVDRRSDRERLLHIPHMNRPRELVRSSRGRSCGVSGCRLRRRPDGYCVLQLELVVSDDHSRIADCNVVVVERLIDLEAVVGVADLVVVERVLDLEAVVGAVV